jgi:hypothetical protein
VPLCPAFSVETWFPMNFLAGLAWNCDLSDLSLPGSENYRHEPLVLPVLLAWTPASLTGGILCLGVGVCLAT